MQKFYLKIKLKLKGGRGGKEDCTREEGNSGVPTLR